MRKLEKKYPRRLVVVGIHSAKFDNEKDTEQIRNAALRHGLHHPIVNDADFAIWNRYGARSWPTLALIGPTGHLYWAAPGETPYDDLDGLIEAMLKKFGDKVTTKPVPGIRPDVLPLTTLAFPLKVTADAKRLYISDTRHHRILETDHDGNVLREFGKKGEEGFADGNGSHARFDHPAGTFPDGEVLWVADTGNHRIRRIDLKTGAVTTVAGTGAQRHLRVGGPAHRTPLNSPWSVLRRGDTLYIAMAGNHSIWMLDLEKKTVQPYAGDGRERLLDGPLHRSSFNQPSGLAVIGDQLFVADSEISGVRAIDLTGKERKTRTIVGTGLFDFGDRDGVGDNALLQHVLAVVPWGEKLLVADAYNHKLKVLDPKTRRIDSFLGDGRFGLVDGSAPRFNEPAGLWVRGSTAWVADQNNHAIRVIDLEKKTVRTLTITVPKKATGEAPPRKGDG